MQIGSKLKGYVNFSYQNTTNDETGKKTTLVPEITGNLGLNYHVIKYVNINLENIYVGKRTSPKILDETCYDPSFTQDEEYKVNAYFLTNITISTKKLKLIRDRETVISISCKDIFDLSYIDPSGVDSKGFDVPHHGRTFLIKLSQNF